MKKALASYLFTISLCAQASPISFWSNDHALSANGLGLDKWKTTLAQKSGNVSIEQTQQFSEADILLLDATRLSFAKGKKQNPIDIKALKNYSADDVRKTASNFTLPKGWTAIALWHGGYAAMATHVEDKTIKHGTTFSTTTAEQNGNAIKIEERSMQGATAEGLLTSLEATPLQMYRQRIDKVLQRIILSNHAHNLVIVAIKESTLAKQSTEQKRYLLDSLRTATTFQIEASEREQAFAIQQMKHAGYANISTKQ